MGVVGCFVVSGPLDKAFGNVFGSVMVNFRTMADAIKHGLVSALRQVLLHCAKVEDVFAEEIRDSAVVDALYLLVGAFWRGDAFEGREPS